MNTRKVLPKWLYHYIFVQQGAKEKADPKDFRLNLESGEEKNRDYLGTYFPRSFAESYCIHQNLFSYKSYHNLLEKKDLLRILSFGCGTGGDIVGLVCAIADMLPQIKNLDITAFDGNNIAIDYLSRILYLSPIQSRFNLKIHYVPMPISSLADLNHYLSGLGNDYDFILSFKFVNELMQMNIFNKDGFKVFADRLAPLLSPEGLMTLLDVTPPYCGEWQPKNLNRGISDFCKGNDYKTLIPVPCHFKDSVCCSGQCYTEKQFYGSFTSYSKVTYRVIGHRDFVNKLYQRFENNATYIRNTQGVTDACPMTKGDNVKDAFDINN